MDDERSALCDIGSVYSGHLAGFWLPLQKPGEVSEQVVKLWSSPKNARKLTKDSVVLSCRLDSPIRLAVKYICKEACYLCNTKGSIPEWGGGLS